MKHLRFSLAVTVLTFALSVPAFAGDIQCPVAPPPPSQARASVTGDMQAGVAPTGETTNIKTTTVDSIAETALQLMLSVLSLF